MQIRYRIYTLSARAIIGYASETEDGFSFRLSENAVRKCILRGSDEQDDNALFFQTMCVLHGDDFTLPEDSVIPDLSDVIFYVDFNRVFDQASSRKYLDRQKKAEAMFHPEGITLDLGSGARSYVAFERSGNMSRQAKLSFIRADLYENVRRRIMMDMTVGRCQLSKLYAYNGLMLSGGVRIDGIGITDPHRVIVIHNEKYTAENVNVITVEGKEISGGYRKYSRVGTKKDIEVTRFDGEGIISKAYAEKIDKKNCGKHIHTSFQIRMPFVKGMLHQVDFKDLLISSGTDTITDIWGISHPVKDVDVILTKSMFKGYGWLTENGMTWEDYLSVFDKYRHALYITNTSKPKPGKYTELNYQFLNTLSMTAEEFRPADLPLGWDHSPSDDERHWITKVTEQRYYELCADENARIGYFAEQDTPLGRCVKKNPLFVREPVCVNELEAKAETLCRDYALGHLTVAGDNRFLSGDLLEFLALLLLMKDTRPGKKRQKLFWTAAESEQFVKNGFYAPGAVYEAGKVCTLLRNPHIARNEEIQLSEFGREKNIRKYYLGHLTDVVMVDASMLAAERLGGADYDGDMIKTIADPLLNECVKRNYEYDSLDNRDNLPLLYIPAEEPVMRDANNWHDRFITVRDTFSSRVGQICNAAFDRSIVAYDENSDSEERKRCREETETLAILTGLEIDSAKSGVKPELDSFLREKSKRSPFLKYKSLIDGDKARAWFEPTASEKLKKYMESTDWNSVSSNVEKLPYYAYMLKKNTKKIKETPAADCELFVFAENPDWKDELDPTLLLAVENLIREYEAVLSRIRSCRAPIKNKAKQTDIERILYSRGQEDLYDTDTLYALFSEMDPERIADIRRQLTEKKWHLMDKTERLDFLSDHLPEAEEYFDLFSDFRFGGYRILGDLICDIDDENNAEERKKLHRDTDSDVFAEMMKAYEEKSSGVSARDAVSAVCRKLIKEILNPRTAVRYLVALGKRNLLWDVVPDAVEKEVRRNAE